MSFDDFRRSIAADALPAAQLTLAVHALWHDARGDWEGAHATVQGDEQNREGAWVHAYLHRKEGDLGNAGYWYARAGRPMPKQDVTLDAEWESIARALIGASGERT